MKRLVAFSTLLAIAVATRTHPVFAGTERFHDTDIRQRLGAGSILEIHNVAGSITATQSDGDTVTVHAHATSSSGADPASVEIRTRQSGRALVVCVVYPGGSCDETRVHRYGNHDSDVRVDFTVGVPAGVALTAHTVDGNIEATGLTSNVAAHDVNGSIRIGTSGSASAHTVQGSIDAKVGTTPHGDDTQFETVNGSIGLELPKNADATIFAKTLNGSIQANGAQLALDTHDFVGRKGTAILGSGTARISLRSINGTITITAI